MVTQKPICLKIDTELLEQLDEEVRLGYRTRNRVINQAIALYLEVLDMNRRVICYHNETMKQDEVEKFLREWIPNAASW